MEFIPLEHKGQLDEIKNAGGYTIIFKHNTTCPISKNVRRHFELEAGELKQVNNIYFLDLLAYREISDTIAKQFKVPHESPQLLLIKDGRCTYSDALYNISVEKISKEIRP